MPGPPGSSCLPWGTLNKVVVHTDWEYIHTRLTERAALRVAARVCPTAPLDSVDHVWGLAYWMQSAWDYMAMGNFVR